jgi:Outer membrane protein beta-barrel domain
VSGVFPAETGVKTLRRIRFGILTFTILLASTTARAQDGGARVSGFFGGSFGEGKTPITTGGSVGYRFTPRFGFDFEVQVMPDTHFDRDRLNRLLDSLRPFAGIVPLPNIDTSGRTVAFLTNFVTEFPTDASWLIPYLEGGGGVASVSRSLVVLPLLAAPAGPLNLAGTVVYPPIFGDTSVRFDGLQRSETDLALTVGGGVDFQLLNGLSVGVNIRYLRLFGTTDDLNLTRLAGRVSYRF